MKGPPPVVVSVGTGKGVGTNLIGLRPFCAPPLLIIEVCSWNRSVAPPIDPIRTIRNKIATCHHMTKKKIFFYSGQITLPGQSRLNLPLLLVVRV
jgi:hypothetical protein